MIINSQGMVELWMSEVDDAMKDALVHYTQLALEEWNCQPELDYLERYPGQSIYCASAISWTKLVSDTIEAGSKWSVGILYRLPCNALFLYNNFLL